MSQSSFREMFLVADEGEKLLWDEMKNKPRDSKGYLILIWHQIVWLWIISLHNWVEKVRLCNQDILSRFNMESVLLNCSLTKAWIQNSGNFSPNSSLVFLSGSRVSPGCPCGANENHLFREYFIVSSAQVTFSLWLNKDVFINCYSSLSGDTSR